MKRLQTLQRKGSGYFSLAFGMGYLEMASVQVKLLRAVNDSHPVSLIVDSETRSAARASSSWSASIRMLFDQLVLYRPECFDDGLNEIAVTAHEHFNMLPELRIDLLTPYREFIKLDLDIVPTRRGTAKVWDLFRERGHAFDCFGAPFDNTWHWGKLGEIVASLKKRKKLPKAADMHHTHAGLMYVNLDAAKGSFRSHIGRAIAGLHRYDELGFLRKYKGGAVDEILFSWSMANSKPAWQPVPFGDLFQFGYSPDCVYSFVHLFTEDQWRAAASNVLGRQVHMRDTDVKAHAEGTQAVQTCKRTSARRL